MGLRYVDRIPRKARVRATRTLFDFPCFPLRASLCLPLLWNFHSEVWLARVWPIPLLPFPFVRETRRRKEKKIRMCIYIKIRECNNNKIICTYIDSSTRKKMCYASIYVENRKKFCSARFSFYPNFEYCPIERILKIWKIMEQLRMYHRGVEIII